MAVGRNAGTGLRGGGRVLSMHMLSCREGPQTCGRPVCGAGTVGGAKWGSWLSSSVHAFVSTTKKNCKNNF